MNCLNCNEKIKVYDRSDDWNSCVCEVPTKIHLDPFLVKETVLITETPVPDTKYYAIYYINSQIINIHYISDIRNKDFSKQKFAAKINDFNFKTIKQCIVSMLLQ